MKYVCRFSRFVVVAFLLGLVLAAEGKGRTVPKADSETKEVILNSLPPDFYRPRYVNWMSHQVFRKLDSLESGNFMISPSALVKEICERGKTHGAISAQDSYRILHVDKPIEYLAKTVLKDYCFLTDMPYFYGASYRVTGNPESPFSFGGSWKYVMSENPSDTTTFLNYDGSRSVVKYIRGTVNGMVYENEDILSASLFLGSIDVDGSHFYAQFIMPRDAERNPADFVNYLDSIVTWPFYNYKADSIPYHVTIPARMSLRSTSIDLASVLDSIGFESPALVEQPMHQNFEVEFSPKGVNNPPEELSYRPEGFPRTNFVFNRPFLVAICMPYTKLYYGVVKQL